MSPEWDWRRSERRSSRDSTQVYYRLQSERVATLCRAVCAQVALELEAGSTVEPTDRLLPAHDH